MCGVYVLRAALLPLRVDGLFSESCNVLGAVQVSSQIHFLLPTNSHSNSGVHFNVASAQKLSLAAHPFPAAILSSISLFPYRTDHNLPICL